MKRIVSLALVLVLALTALVGCGGAKEKEYTLAIGVAVTPNTASSSITQTVASIVTDTDGKIVLARLDCAEYKAYDGGALVETAPTSKVALGDAYGGPNENPYLSMPAGSFEKQAAALEKYVVGKTRTEVAATALDGEGKATDTDLKASCSIYVVDLLKAIDKAFASEHKVSFKSTATDFTAGLAIYGAIESDEDNVTYAADFSSVVMLDGAVVAAIIDTAEPTLVGATAEGAESFTYAGTKREQGDAYDSWQPMAAGRWYQQADAYAASAIGKTAQDIATLASEGVAGCTIYAGGYKASIEAAVKAAR